MDKNVVSIVICCAGMGTRLGIGATKALVDICGKPLILHQLELLEDYQDIRIVVGYQAERVIDVVKNYRKDIMFAFNYNYQNTGAAASLVKGAMGAKKFIVSMDGDLLVNPKDFEKFMQHEGECIAISENYSDEPIMVATSGGKARYFSRQGKYEWPGLAKIEAKHLKMHDGHTYEMLEKVFPIDAIFIRCRDIDTEDDYDRAISWVKEGCID